jgi:hypothetical protein
LYLTGPSQAEVPREEMYFISADQYHEDTKFIKDIEEALLGVFCRFSSFTLIVKYNAMIAAAIRYLINWGLIF